MNNHHKTRKTKRTIGIGIVIALLVAGALWAKQAGEKKSFGPGRLDTFAQCLRDKGVVMYGAAWCKHCQNEKKAFGSSFQYVTYVECPQNPKACLEKDVTGYPTWILPDGKKLEGEQGLLNLSKESSCPLP